MFLHKKYLRFYYHKTIAEAQSVVYIDQQKNIAIYHHVLLPKLRLPFPLQEA
jgi:hypothetical protein